MEICEEDFVPDYEEDVEISESEPPRGIGAMTRGGRPCRLCPHRFSHLRRHMLVSHLPWYFDPFAVCWNCKTVEPQVKFLDRHLKSCGEKRGRFSRKWTSRWKALILGLLWTVMNLVGCKDEREFVEWIVMNDCIKGITINSRDEQIIKLFDASIEGVIKMDNSVSQAHLVHWRVFSNILTKLSHAQVQQIGKLEKLRLLSVTNVIAR